MFNEYVVVTGGAGFLGSNLIRKLNDNGINKIIIVDNYEEKKFVNLKALSFANYVSYKQGLTSLKATLSKYDLSAIIHIGANADVLIKDPDIMLEANYEHSKFYLELAQEKNICLIYASSSAIYGNGATLGSSNKSEDPHNVYAWSKWLFDRFVLSNLSSFTNRVIGLRLFNMFGMGEFHKGKNASIPLRFFTFICDKGFIDVFDRQILRDYVWVEDVADIIVELLNDSSVLSGIYDVGGNNPISHNAVAKIVASSFIEYGIKSEKEVLVKTTSMPLDLADNFQFYTKANDLIPLIANRTMDNEKKIMEYLSQLLKIKYNVSKI